ncbi:MAG: hypothetical protein HC833_04150 [Leptolyngbyaceae cyanobacterium RM1_406_9]|nr:hypothetical protein [Leptolyngbyaceae cyanobacterium RM1_406_9]
MRKIPFQFSHGGYIREKFVERTTQGTGASAIDVETDFNYLFPDLSTDPHSLLPADNPADTIAKLKDLGNAMIDAQAPIDPEDANSKIPPVYTYWGQFIDHDVTANTDRASQDLQTDITKDDFQPLAPDFVTEKLKNLRRPVFDLDSVYGDGPTLNPANPTEAKDFYQEEDPVKLRIGQNALKDSAGNDVPGDKIPPVDDLMRDLPRKDRNAIIGDSRNDENLIVAQLHTAFLRFHNAVVDWVRTNEPKSFKDEHGLFERSQNLVRWHHQWLVVNDFLKTLTVNGTVDNILNSGLKFYDLRHRDIFMPLEFSVAAYRFGHSMVRAAYDYNRNFGREAVLIPSASFELLFSFTGRGNIGERNGPGANDTLPFNWIIEWDRFVDKAAAEERQTRSARKIDTRLTPPLSTMINEGEDESSPMIKELLKHLAKRNLLRGYLLSIPTGQSLAAKLGVPKLTPEELKQDNSDAMNQALEPFLEKTPAWFYILKESEVRAKGETLGEVGSRLVAETFIGLMMHDPASYLNQRDYNGQRWEPSKGVKLPNGSEIRTIGDFLKFAGVML